MKDEWEISDFDIDKMFALKTVAEWICDNNLKGVKIDIEGLEVDAEITYDEFISRIE